MESIPHCYQDSIPVDSIRNKSFLCFCFIYQTRNSLINIRLEQQKCVLSWTHSPCIWDQTIIVIIQVVHATNTIHEGSPGKAEFNLVSESFQQIVLNQFHNLSQYQLSHL